MPEFPITLDGSEGEGGGQILRTALSLSAITGKPFALHRVRANRIKPGLRPQHTAAARAVAELVDAETTGVEVGSSRVEFTPRRRTPPGEYAFDIGTAGSTPLLFQTLCWPLALAAGPSMLTLRGGTHQQYSPTFHYLAMVWQPAVARLGFQFDLKLTQAGFYPEGGGEFTARIEPAHAMPPLDLLHRGTLLEVDVFSMVGGLPLEVAERQAKRALYRLRQLGVHAESQNVPVPCRLSRGSHVLVIGHFERTHAGFGAIGEKGKSAEAVADEMAKDFSDYLTGAAAVERYLGDQLVVPAAIAAAGLLGPPTGVVPTTRYSVSQVTKHLTTNAMVVQRFLDVEIVIDGREGEPGEVHIRPAGAGANVTALPRP